MKLPHPSTLVWNEGPIPRVEDVSADCIVVIWGGTVKTIRPHGDELNPTKWCDGSGFPFSMSYKPTATSWDGYKTYMTDIKEEHIPFIWAYVVKGNPKKRHQWPTHRETYPDYVDPNPHPQIPR